MKLRDGKLQVNKKNPFHTSYLTLPFLSEYATITSFEETL